MRALVNAALDKLLKASEVSGDDRNVTVELMDLVRRMKVGTHTHTPTHLRTHLHASAPTHTPVVRASFSDCSAIKR
jgi:hypothetical protein